MKPQKITDIKRKPVFLGPINVVCDPSIQELCLHRYPNHTKGCPKYGKKAKRGEEECPPRALFFPDKFHKKVYIAAIVFDFKQFLSWKKEIHPDWTERALRNQRHWQGHLRSELRKFVSGLGFKKLRYHKVIFKPETMGVNVTNTCKNVGLKLEWPPNNIVCEVALIAKTKKGGVVWP